MGIYGEMIQKATGCNAAEAKEAEDIMRNDLFHSTLDWQPKALFDKAASLAVKILRGEPVPKAVAKAIYAGQPVTLTSVA